MSLENAQANPPFESGHELTGYPELRSKDVYATTALAAHAGYLKDPLYGQAWQQLSESIRTDRPCGPAPITWLTATQRTLEAETTKLARIAAKEMQLRTYTKPTVEIISRWELAAQALQTEWKKSVRTAGSIPSVVKKARATLPALDLVGTADDFEIQFEAEHFPDFLPKEANGFPNFADAATRIHYRIRLGHEVTHPQQDRFEELLRRATAPSSLEISRDVLGHFNTDVQAQVSIQRLRKLTVREPREWRRRTEQAKEAVADHIGLRIGRLSSRHWNESPVDAIRASARFSARRAKDRAALTNPEGTPVAAHYSVGSLFMRRAAAERPATGFCPTAFATLAIVYPALLPEPGETPTDWVRRCAVLATGEFLDPAMLRRYDQTYLKLLSKKEGLPALDDLSDWQGGAWPNPDGTLATPNQPRAPRQPRGARPKAAVRPETTTPQPLRL